MKDFIGREYEADILQKAFESNNNEFIFLTGRKNIGKNTLIHYCLGNDITFYYAAKRNLTLAQQLERFALELMYWGNVHKVSKFKNWNNAFLCLNDLIEHSYHQKKVVIINNIPDIDSNKANFVKKLIHFWNSWTKNHSNLMLIVSSSTGYLVNDVSDKNKNFNAFFTKEIELQPFSLAETERFFNTAGFCWNRFTILQAYMIFGGIPHYLNLLNPKLTLAQNINELFFAKNAPLQNELDKLCESIFDGDKSYLTVLKCLAENSKGLSRKKLNELCPINKNTLSKILQNISKCRLIQRIPQMGDNQQVPIYKLVDLFSLFYFMNIQHRRNLLFSHNEPIAEYYQWQHFAFETMCQQNLSTIKSYLGVQKSEGILYCIHSNEQHINILPNKKRKTTFILQFEFVKSPIQITPALEQKLKNNTEKIKTETHAPKAIHNILVSPFGTKSTPTKGIISREIKLNDLFLL